ncbi:MAG: hypothetical protein QOE70_1862 [Chthoniobacter sp.]|nr:hypothetical protein [Chthoniobacter sp.]
MIRAAWSWLWDRSVRRQLVTGVVLVYVAVMSVFVAQLVARQRAFLREKAESWALFEAAQLAASSLPGMMNNDLAGLQEILEPLRADKGLRYAMILDPQGRILAHTDKSKSGRFLQDARSIELLKSQPASRLVSSNRETVEYAAPVLIHARHFGWVRVARDLSDDNRHLQELTLWGIGFTMVATLIGTVVTVGLAGAILRPLKLLLRGTERIAHNRLDEPIPITTRNEVGVVTAAFNNAMAQLARQIAERTEADEHLRGQTVRILEEAKVLALAAENILTTATRFTATAADTAHAMGNTTVAVEELRQISQLASEQARDVSENAQSAADISVTGKEAAAGAGEGMQRIRDQMGSINMLMRKLSEQTDVIVEIIATVDELSKSSNLLALNAAIEAAKAGEHGRGFAIVAQEVRHLAGQSKQATTNIRAILNQIQNATDDAVLATEVGLTVVDRGAGQSAAAGNSILTLWQSISHAAERAAQIAASTREQFAGIEQIGSAMHSMKTASARNVEGAQELERAARNLRDLGQRLSGLAAAPAVKPPRS